MTLNLKELTLVVELKKLGLILTTYYNKIIIAPFTIEYQIYCTLGWEYFPRPAASGNIPTLGAINLGIQ